MSTNTACSGSMGQLMETFSSQRLPVAPPLSDVLAHFILPAVPACLPSLNTTRTLLRIEMHLALTLTDLSSACLVSGSWNLGLL